MAGINQRDGDVAVSWGTSDTVFVWLDKPRPALDMHVLANPVDANAYMGMLWYGILHFILFTAITICDNLHCKSLPTMDYGQ